VAVASSACAYGGTPADPAALSVGGRSVSTSDLEDQLEFLAGEPAAAQALFGGEVAIEGDAPGSYSPQAANVLVNLHLQRLVIGALVDELGVEVGEEARTAARQQVDGAFGGTELPASLDEALVELVAGDQTVGEAVQAGVADQEVPEEELRAAYEQALPQRTEVCASHILIGFTDDLEASRDPSFEPSDEQVAAAEDAIEAAQARLDAGEAFADVAREVSDDTGSAVEGGDLGCGPPGQYVEEFAVAAADQPVGEVGDPVTTMFGIHLILVTERTEPTFEELEDELREAALQPLAQERFAELRDAVFDRLDIEVDPRFGTWDAEAFQVVPPAGAQDAPTAEEPVEGFDPSLLDG
jgi:hypothetical protein